MSSAGRSPSWPKFFAAFTTSGQSSLGITLAINSGLKSTSHTFTSRACKKHDRHMWSFEIIDRWRANKKYLNFQRKPNLDTFNALWTQHVMGKQLHLANNWNSHSVFTQNWRGNFQISAKDSKFFVLVFSIFFRNCR